MRPLSWFSPSLSVISAAVIAFGKSCLLANINKIASLSSSSFNLNFTFKISLKIYKIYKEAYHFAKFFSSLANSFSVVAVDYEYETLRVLKVVSPQWTNLVLTTYIPHGEANVLVLDSLNVETNCRYSCHYFA